MINESFQICCLNRLWYSIGYVTSKSCNLLYNTLKPHLREARYPASSLLKRLYEFDVS